MKKISKAELDGLKKDGLTVRRKMGAQPEKPDATPKDLPKKGQDLPKGEKEKTHASMSASMHSTAAEREALRLLVAKNTEVIEQFKKELETLARPASDYTFDVLRDEDKLMKRIHARAGIHED